MHSLEPFIVGTANIFMMYGYDRSLEIRLNV
jgi:hypothetical protein